MIMINHRCQLSGPPRPWASPNPPPSELEHCDIARLNLLCAEALPGAEKLSVKECQATLDQWAQHIKAETDRNHHYFKADPAYYAIRYDGRLSSARRHLLYAARVQQGISPKTSGADGISSPASLVMSPPIVEK